MAYQVGYACYADLLSAANKHCADFESTSTTISSGVVVSLTCLNGNANGSILLRKQMTALDGTSTFQNFNAWPVSQPCMYQDFVDAGILILVAVLSAWVGWYGIKKAKDLIDWSRGDAS